MPPGNPVVAGYTQHTMRTGAGRATHVLFLGVVAAASTIALLSGAGLSTIEGFAIVVLGLQAAAALSVLALGLARRPLEVAVGGA